MKIERLLLFVVLMLAGCARLPEIRTIEGVSSAEHAATCAAIFPQGRWQFVHSLQIHPPTGSEQTVLGVIQLSSQQRTFHCVLMTIEGLVLFEADFDGAVTVQRALPPLDKPGMAEGIVYDISLIFLAPQQPVETAGVSEDAGSICRYPAADRGVEDVALKQDGLWEIRLYNQSHRLTRRVSAMSNQDPNAGGLPSMVVLKAPGALGYTLKMSLIEATPLE
jgi:hypothetical protein